MIIHNRKALIKYKDDLGIPNKKVQVAKYHHDLVFFVGVMQSILHDIHLNIWLKRVVSEKKIKSQMHFREVGVGRDDVSFIFSNIKD